MASPRNSILTPVGRLVAGSLYKPNDKDAEGKPLIIKTGPQAGQPRKDYFFALAIPKGAEQHWGTTPWGAIIWQTGQAAFPGGQGNSPAFAWKVKDGDSTVPNRKGNKPVDQEGWKGCWVLMWSSGFAPKIYNADGSQQIVEPDAVKLGYYVQVSGSVGGNDSLQQPGVFLNHNMVALAAYGPEISTGPDAASVGFGAGVALPPGASLAPLGGGFNPAPAAPAVLPTHTLPPLPAPTTAVTPNPAILAIPPARTMTAKANGASYEQLVGVGWTDALLRQEGMML